MNIGVFQTGAGGADKAISWLSGQSLEITMPTPSPVAAPLPYVLARLAEVDASSLKALEEAARERLNQIEGRGWTISPSAHPRTLTRAAAASAMHAVDQSPTEAARGRVHAMALLIAAQSTVHLLRDVLSADDADPLPADHPIYDDPGEGRR